MYNPNNADFLKGLSKRQLKGKTRIKFEETFVVDSPEWVVVVPHTHRAAIHWSKNAHWDTGIKHDDIWFNEYNKRGDLYIMWNKSTNKGYQLHVETKSLFDDKNSPVRPQELFSRNPKIFCAIYLHLKPGKNRNDFVDMLG